MKKVNFLFLMIMLLLTLIACGENKNTIKNETEIITNTEIEENKDTTVTSEIIKTETQNLLIPNMYKVPLREIYIDIPNYNDIESGYTRIYKDGESKYVTFNYFTDETAGTPAETFEIAYPKFKNNVSSWHRINTEEFTSMEEVEINGITAQKVIGTVEYGMKTMIDCYLYGYSFIFEDVPCAIIGVVSDKTQPQEEIDELIAIVDAMMESVRTEP